MFYNNLREEKEDILPLTELQKSIFAAVILNKNDYLEIIKVYFEKEIDVDILKRVLNKIVQEQQALRVVFKMAGAKEPVQILLKRINLPLYFEENIPLPNIETEPWNIILNNQEHSLELRYCHIVMDGWGMSIFWNELIRGYHLLKNGLAWRQKIPYSLRDYHEKILYLHTEYSQLSIQDEYSYDCHSCLSDVLYPIEKVENDERYSVDLQAETIANILRISSKIHVTPATVLYAAWALLLSALTGKDKVCMGIILSGRNYDEGMQNAIGMFIQKVPLCVNVRDMFNDLCYQVRNFFEKEMVKSLDAEKIATTYLKDSERSVAYDTLVAIENYPLESLNNNSLGVIDYEYYERPSNTFTLQVRMEEEKIEVVLSTNEFRFRCNLANILDSYIYILDQLKDECIENKKIALCNNSVKLQENHCIQPLQTLDEAIIKACVEYSEQTAIIDNGKAILYKELFHLALRGAATLHDLGVESGSVVGVYMVRSIEQLISTYAIVLAGCVYVPFTNVPVERAHYMIAQAGVSLMITDTVSLEFDCRCICYEALIKNNNEIEPRLSKPIDTAYILFTSGSTGHPKGCEISHQSIVNRLCWNARKLKLTKDTKQLYKTPVTFDVSLIEIFSIFFSGHTLFVLPDGEERLPDKILAAIYRYQINYIHFVPSMLQIFYEYLLEFEELNKFRSVELLVCSGEILPSELVRKMYDLSQNLQIVNLYGPTEAAVDVSCYFCGNEIETVQTPIGKAIDNTTLFVFDQWERLLPCGVRGEIYISGDNLGKGYINQPELTQKSFVKLTDGSRAYRTGDLGYRLNSGDLIVVGRMDEQIKYNGIRIEPAELEFVLLKSGLVYEAVVLLKKQYSSKLIVFYRSKDACEQALAEYLRGYFPEAMLPNVYVFLEKFPLSLHGKVDREKLIEIFDKKCENELKCIQKEDGMNATEKRVGEIWKDILDSDSVYHAQDNFFACGGNSISLIRMVIAIRKAFNINLSLSKIYDNPTIKRIAEEIALCAENDITLDSRRLSIEAKKKMILFQLNHPGSTAYNLPIMIRIKKECSFEQCKDALLLVLNKYEWLHKRYVCDDNVLWEKIVKEDLETIEQIQCTKLELHQCVENFVAPFSIQERLFRVQSVNCEQENYILLDFHHLLMDQTVIKFLLLAWIDFMENQKMPESITCEPLEKIGTLENVENKIYDESGRVLENIAPILYTKLGKLGRYSFELEQININDINLACKEYGCSKFQMLLAAFGLLCRKISGKTKIILGTNTVGDDEISQKMQLKILPVKCELKSSYQFRDIVHDIAHELAKTMGDNSDIRESIFDVMFIREEELFNNKRTNKYIEQVTMINKEVKCGLSLFYKEVDDNILLRFDFDRGLFEKQAIIDFAKSFNAILNSMLCNPECKISECCLIEENTKKKIEEFCLGNTVELPSKLLQDFFVDMCKREPFAPIIYEDDKCITRKELYILSSSIADEIKKNFEADTIIGVYMPLGVKYLATIMGILMAGCTYMPFDIMWPKKRCEQLLSLSNAVMCIIDDTDIAWEVDTIFRKFSSFKEVKETSVRFSKNAYCIFTSGSTGSPKGCVVSQKNAINYLMWANDFYCEGKQQCFGLFTSPAVDMTITSSLLPLVYGHVVAIYPQKAESFIRVISDKRVTILKVTPSHLEMLNKYDIYSEIKCLIIGGEQLKTDLVKKIRRMFKNSINIYNEYGPTEATVACMVYKYSEKDEFTVVPIGRPIQNFKVSVRDEYNELSLIGTCGELIIEGAGVIGGYINGSETMRSGFRCTADEKWSYKTGDKARMLSNGNVIFEGRNDDQFKISGHRVELAELSAAAQNINEVEQAYATVEKGHLLLFCKLREDFVLSELELRRKLFELIPRYMIPSEIHFLQEIPLSSSGKIDRKAVIETWKLKKQNKDQNEVHNFIRQCWEEELGTDNFSNEDGFLEVGGNSITMVSLHRRLISRFPNLTIADLFCYPSISTLSEYVLEKNEGVVLYQKEENRKETDKVAIVGVGFELPDANDFDSLHNVFRKGKSCARFLTGQRAKDEKLRLDNLGRNSGEFRFAMVSSLARIDYFDNDYFNIGKDEADIMDPAHKLLMSVVDDALTNAGITKEQIKGCNCAVILAMPTDIGYLSYLKEVYPSLAMMSALNQVPSSIAGHIAFFYDLHGPAFLIDCACSSGLAALERANALLVSGECDMAIVGGVNLVDAIDYVDEEHAQVLSGKYHANAFSTDADGTARGEGCICYVLERLEMAKRHGHFVHAVIAGAAANNDGFSASLTAPNGLMQEKVIRQAWLNAGITSNDLDLMETHGTATPLGDAVELQALNNVMEGAKPGHCALSAAKTVFGHLDTVSGLLGVLKCIVSLKYNELYPLVGMVKPMDSKKMISSAFFLPDRVMEWDIARKEKVVCGVSSFGLSGTNVHLVLCRESYDKGKVHYETRLAPKRCWLPEVPEKQVIREDLIVQNNVRNYDEKEVMDLLIEKVKTLFSGRTITPDTQLYQAGFDSVSVIQLKIFIQNEFRVNIDVASTDTLRFLANQIVRTNKIEIFTKERETIVKNEVEEKEEESWGDFQFRYALLDFKNKYISKTKLSYEKLLDEDLPWANGRFMTGYTKGLEAFSYPILIDYGQGAEVWDIDGNHYIDFSMGFGAMLFGYKHPYIMEKVENCLSKGFVLGPLMESPFILAERICKMTGVERVSFCNSGTEAIMNLIRIARAITGKDKIIVFEGAFHGTYDPVYVQKNELSQGMIPIPRSMGTPYHYLDDIIMLRYGEESALDYIKENKEKFAAVLVEPIQSRHPALRPKEFIRKLRDITDQTGILLIFDEVISGFRNGVGGAQEYYGIRADLVAYGKVIGGGFPIGIFGGQAKYLDVIDHRGGLTKKSNARHWVSTGGTFNGHPASIAAGMAVLDLLEDGKEEIYSRINKMTLTIVNELNAFFKENNFHFIVESYGSQFIITGGEQRKLRLLQYLLVEQGIFVWEGGTCFVSTAHTWEHIHEFIEITKKCVCKMKELVPQPENIAVRIDDHICPEDYLQIKRIVTKNSNLLEIRCLEENLMSVLAYNVAHHSIHADYAMVHLCVNEKINENRLENCFNRVINGHLHLRSAISWRKLKQPIRLVYKEVKCPFEVHRCQESEKEEVIKNIIFVRKKNGFTLESAPLLFFDVVIGEYATDIILSYYNSWFDGWSTDEILTEIKEALLYDKYPMQNMDWNEYDNWIEQNNEEIENYWKAQNLSNINIKPLVSMEGECFEVRESIPSRIVDKLQKFCEMNKISHASVYLSAMADALKTDYIMTIVSGRGVAVKGILHEVGLFSGLVPIRARKPAEINAELEILNRLPICSNQKLAELTGVNVNSLVSLAMSHSVIILNHYKDDDDYAQIVEDESYVHVPMRSYIKPEKEILITGNTAYISKEDAETIAGNFVMKLEQIIEGATK